MIKFLIKGRGFLIVLLFCFNLELFIRGWLFVIDKKISKVKGFFLIVVMYCFSCLDVSRFLGDVIGLGRRWDDIRCLDVILFLVEFLYSLSLCFLLSFSIVGYFLCFFVLLSGGNSDMFLV